MKNTKLLFCVVFVLGISAWGYAVQTQTDEVTTSDRLFTGPLQTSGNDLWHSLILIPSLEGAETVKTAELYLRGGLEYATGIFSRTSGVSRVGYDAEYVRPFVEGRYGFADRIELRGRVNTGALSEYSPLILSDNGIQHLNGNDGGIGVSNVVLGVKIPALLQGPMYKQSLSMSVKLPISNQKNLIDSDSVDVAITYFHTRYLRPDLTLHAYLGYTFAGKIDVFDNNFRPDDVVFYGAGLSWKLLDKLVWINQLQGNSSAFKDMAVLGAWPMMVHSGIRYSEDGKFYNEVGFGAGLNEESSDFTFTLAMGMMF